MVAAVIVFALIQIAGFAFFYLYIVGQVRRKLENSISENIEKDLNALVTEFNRSALQNVELIEERINRLKEAVAESKDVELSLAKTTDRGMSKREKVRRTADDVAPSTYSAVSAYRSTVSNNEKSDMTVSVGQSGVREENIDIQARIVSLFESGVTVREIAERVDMSRGEVEVILGMHGKL